MMFLKASTDRFRHTFGIVCAFLSTVGEGFSSYICPVAPLWRGGTGRWQGYHIAKLIFFCDFSSIITADRRLKFAVS
jgi:hypothetical protein